MWGRNKQVIMDNGIVKVTLSNPGGIVAGIQFNGIDNLLQNDIQETSRGYWDLVWANPGNTGTTGTFDVIKGKSFKVIVENENQVEISFTRLWDPSLQGKHPSLNIDKRFIMLQGCSGFYSYAIYEHLQEWPGFQMPETRIVFRLRKDKFHYMAMADDRKGRMPMPDDRLPGRCTPLAYPEAVLLTNPTYAEFKGEVDDKYQYSCENKDNRVHGWICSDPLVGFWMITPSDEFKTGGPVKQDLTSHVGPITLGMFVSAHYSGDDLVVKIGENEPWKKVFGPVFVYLNSGKPDDIQDLLWEDAKTQMSKEVNNWPYDFPASEDFPHLEQRGSVSGRLLVRERYIDKDDMSANSAYVGVALPGEAGSWQRESKGYQFWTRTNEEGNFTINNIRAGDYNLYAWVPGFLGDFKYATDITITPGCKMELGDVVYEPPRDGPTLWEIGIPDRSAAEFFIPEPMYINKLIANQPNMRFRQYGLWEMYPTKYPDDDLIYTIDGCDYRKDWFFAQVTRKIVNSNTYQGTTWQIAFILAEPDQSGTYKLRIALASASNAELQVRINDPNVNPPLFTSGLIGKDNAVARHGIHGLYWLFNIDVSGGLLLNGKNTIFLTQAEATNPWQEIMYDYIRLEGPPCSC